MKLHLWIERKVTFRRTNHSLRQTGAARASRNYCIPRCPACEPPRGRDRWVAAGENRTDEKMRTPPLGPNMLDDRAEGGPYAPIALKSPFVEGEC